MEERTGARELLRRVLDGGAWTSWDVPVAGPPWPDPAYERDLAAARERSGCDEAVVTGAGELGGRRVGFAVSEFRFLAGSIGTAAAGRIVAAVERATAERLPLLAAPCSGGTRMQEGTAAFVQMARIAAAVMAHRAAGLPYLVYLRHPTTGGVFASWGSLGHVTAAEPGALIGFLGPRVYEGMYGEPFPAGVQVAENLAAKGLVDVVAGTGDLATIASRALDVLCARPPAAPVPARRPTAVPGGPVRDSAVRDSSVRDSSVRDSSVWDSSVWDSIVRSRRRDRPGVRELLRHGASRVTPLAGTGDGEAAPGLLLALARFGNAPCVLAGQDRRVRWTGRAL
ncbi:acetyl-CoA carboxylase carboxyltransferase subunit beta, partial [Actinomadura roseirufa]|uniref:acetyl-CoA carboxylase carboxyltransferase subunit beta n=1 Tax=Actinomadura roseirufa TaxID=2094049 RepID=UPI001A9549B0